MNGNGQLYVMVGPPFTGKTHWIDTDGFEEAFPQMRPPAVIDPDRVRRALTGRFAVLNTTAAEDVLWANIVLMVRAMLLNGNNVILDTCNTRRFQRDKWRSFDPVYVVMDTPLKTALQWAKESSRDDVERVIRKGFDSFDPVHISEGMQHRVTPSQ